MSTQTRHPPREGEAGFTMIEVLAALPIGMIVMAIAFNLLMNSAAMQVKLADRQDAFARGRSTMDLVTRQLRSSVCLPSLSPARSIESADANTITFYADLGDGSVPAQKRVLSYSAATLKLTENDYLQTSASPVTYSATPTRTVVLGEGVQNIAGKPIFGYYPFTSAGVISTTPLAVPLSASDAARSIDIVVSFQMREGKGVLSSKTTAFTEDVYSRTADPTTPTAPPPCFF